jgi:hypothetical protein
LNVLLIGVKFTEVQYLLNTLYSVSTIGNNVPFKLLNFIKILQIFFYRNKIKDKFYSYAKKNTINMYRCN